MHAVEVNRLSLPALFAQNLLVARLARNWTQQALANASGISRATIAQLEAGVGDPKLSTVHDLAQALGISPLLLLAARADLHAIASLPAAAPAPDLLNSPAISTMRHLVSSGFIRSRLEATRIGVTLVQKANLSDGNDPHAAAAAIGSFHFPGPGTLVAAQLSNAHAANPVA